MFGLYLNLRDRLTHYYTINNETLSFTALMIQESKNLNFYFLTLITATHSNIHTFDIFKIFLKISS